MTASIPADTGSSERGWRFWRRRPPLVIGVRLDGVIGLSGFRGLNFQGCERRLDVAFKAKRAKAVALFINSPGGAPVQAALIHDRVRWLSERHERPVVAFLGDVAASGGYWLALAADEIFAHSASIVGSIGVITSSFGFDRAIERLGVERRHYATGAHKGMLDPFRAEDAGDVEILKELHADTYGDFVELVRQRRGGRLVEDADGTLFDGRVFSGKTAKARGLVDAVGDPHAILRARFGETVKLKMLEPRPRPLWARLRGGAGETADVIDRALYRLEERLLYHRYGL